MLLTLNCVRKSINCLVLLVLKGSWISLSLCALSVCVCISNVMFVFSFSITEHGMGYILFFFFSGAP